MLENEFVRYPRTVVQLADEIRKAIDLYWNRGLDEKTLKELIIHWANLGMLLQAQNLNRTIKKIIGKKREKVVLMMLEGYQFKILENRQGDRK